LIAESYDGDPRFGPVAGIADTTTAAVPPLRDVPVAFFTTQTSSFAAHVGEVVDRFTEMSTVAPAAVVGIATEDGPVSRSWASVELNTSA
jgi:hypothetical protein